VDLQFLDPRLTIVLAHEITDRIVPAHKREVPIKRIIFLEVSIMLFVNSTICLELLVDLFEKIRGC